MVFNKVTSYAAAASSTSTTLPLSWTVGSGWGGSRHVPAPTNEKPRPVFKFTVTPPDSLPCADRHYRVPASTHKMLANIAAPRPRQTLRISFKEYVAERIYDHALKAWYTKPEREARVDARRPGATATSSAPLKRLQRLRVLINKYKAECRQLASRPRPCPSPIEPLPRPQRLPRSIMLLYKIRSIIYSMSESRKPQPKLLDYPRMNARRTKRLEHEASMKELVNILCGLAQMPSAFGQIKIEVERIEIENSRFRNIPFIPCDCVIGEQGQVGDLKNATINLNNPSFSGDSKLPDNITVNLNLSENNMHAFSSLLETQAKKLFSAAKVKVKNWADKSISIVLAIAGAVPSKSKITWLTSALQICHTLELYDAKCLGELISTISGGLSGAGELLTDSIGNILPGEQAQMPYPYTRDKTDKDDVERWSRFATVVWQGLGAAMAVKGLPPAKNVTDLANKFMLVFKNESRATNGFLSFFKNLLLVINDCIVSIVEWWNPALRELSNAAHYDVMKDQWISEIAALRLICNSSTVWTQNLINRLEACILVAQQFLRVSVTDPALVPNQFNQLLLKNYDWCLEQRRIAQQKGFAAITRYTPFCLYLFGEPGIGKSESVTSFIPTLQKALEIEDVPNLVFTKPSVAEFWTGCDTQPICVFDDFEQVSHSNPSQSDGAALIYLKSSAPFNPPMAEITSKHLMYSPKCVIVCSNTSHPRPVYMTRHEALWRRRDILVEVKLKPGCSMSQVIALNRTVRSWDHLDFIVYHDPCNSSDSKTTVLSYTDFKQYMSSVATAYHQRERSLFHQRLAIANKRLDNIVSTVTEKADSIVKDTIDSMYNTWCKDLENSGLGIVKRWWTNTKDFVLRAPQPAPISSTEKLDALLDSEKAEQCRQALLKTANPVHDSTVPDDFSAFEYQDFKAPLPDETLPSGSGQMSPPKKYVLVGDEALTYEGWDNPFHHLTQIICKHCDKTFMLSRYNAELHKFVPINETPEHPGFSPLRCNPVCVFQDPVVYKYFRNHINSHEYMKILADKRNLDLVKNTHIFKPDQMPTFTEKAKKIYKNVREALSSPMKTVLTFLKVALTIVLGLVVCIGVLFGVTTGCVALGKWFTQNSDEPSSYCDIYKDTFREGMTEWSTMYEDQAKIRASIIANAALIAERTQRDNTDLQSDAYSLLRDVKHSNKPSIKPSTAVAQSQVIDQLIALVKRNTFFLSVTGVNKHTGAGVHTTCRGFGIGDTWALIPRHYIWVWNQLDIQKIVYINGKEEISLRLDSVKRVLLVDKEICAIRLNNICRFRNISKHFMNTNDWSGPMVRDISIIEIGLNGSITLRQEQSELMQQFNVCMDDKVLATIGPVIKYQSEKPGMCMSVILGACGKIMGFHIAGGKTGGYAEPILYEEIMSLNKLDIEDCDLKYVLDSIPGEPMQNPTLDIDTNVQIIGKVKREYTRYETGKTAIIPSRIHNVFPITTKPAPLRACEENNYSDPLEHGVRKHGLPCNGFGLEHLTTAGRFFEEMLANTVQPIFQTGVDVWTEQQACNGVSSIPNLQPIVLQTSEGFPYCFERPELPKGTPAKQWLLNRVDDPNGNHTYKFHPKLRKILDEKAEMRRKRISPCSVFVDCLKDARLPVEKCSIPGKVRIFSISPLDYIIQYRQYFAPFIGAYVTSRLHSHHAIGIAPEKIDWTELAFRLQSKGPKVLCGDYSNFGPAFAKDVHMVVNDKILSWFKLHGASEEDNSIREILQHEVLHAVHLAKDALYDVPCGMPSGSPETTVKNSCVNTVYVYYIWLYIWSKIDVKMCTFDALNKHLYFVTYGDDLIANVSDVAAEHFNNETIQQAFAEHGVKYTDELKGNTIRKWCTLSEATFLKRSFKPHPYRSHVIMSSVDSNIARDVSNWIHKVSHDEFVEASKEASYQTLALSYGQGMKFYDETREILAKKWRECGVRDFTPRTWKDLDEQYYGVLHSGINWLEDPYSGNRQLDITGENAQMSELMSTEIASNVSLQTQDTILQTHDVPSVETDPILGVTTASLATTDRIVQLPKLTDRQVVLGNYAWNKDQAFGTKIAEWNLPTDGVLATAASPNWQLLRSFAYYRPSEIVVTVSLNASKFAAGQLQISAYYDGHLDANAKLRENPYSRSQMLHAILDAGSSNSVQLRIPYRHYNPWMRISSDKDFDQCVNVLLLVLAPYDTPDGVATTANIVVTWSMDGCELTGMRPALALSDSGQMLPMAAAMAMQYLSTRLSDKNRDKPPVQLNASPLEPRATGTLGLGTNTTEHLQALRLDARGQVPHPDGTDVEDSFTSMARRYGLFKRLDWSMDDSVGKKLLQIHAGPLIDVSMYDSEVLQASPEIRGYAIPPCGVVASMFDQYAGGVKYRFDIVGSQMHTGSLMVTFVPGYVSSTNLPYAVARYSYNVVYDIHEQRTFEFETPFVCDKPWWPVLRVNAKDESRVLPYGTICVYVVNPLIPMANVSKSVKINMYVAASDNFRLSIPIQPQFSLPWYLQSSSSPDDGTVFAKPGYYPYYIGTWRYLHGGVSPILRWGTLSDEIAQFSDLVQGFDTTGQWVYYTNTDLGITLSIERGEMSPQHFCFVPVDVGDGYGLIYLAVHPVDELGRLFKTKYTKGAAPDWSQLYVLKKSSLYTANKNFPLKRNLYTFEARVSESDSDFEVVGQMPDPRYGTTVVEAPASETSPQLALDTYGEDFDSIKTLLRRYEYVDSIAVNVSSTTLINTVHLTMFALPQGYSIDIGNQTSDQARDGLQSLVLSSFRYFRGSLNYKFALLNTRGTLWVQHHPDRAVTDVGVKQRFTSSTGYYKHGYASALGSINVNPILTVNIPYYNPNSFMLLQPPDLTKSSQVRRAMSLGEIQAGVNIPTTSNHAAQLHVYKSLGDDASPSTFIGFPRVVPTYIYSHMNKLSRSGHV